MGLRGQSELRIQRSEFGEDEADRICRVGYQRAYMNRESSKNLYTFALKLLSHTSMV